MSTDKSPRKKEDRAAESASRVPFKGKTLVDYQHERDAARNQVRDLQRIVLEHNALLSVHVPLTPGERHWKIGERVVCSSGSGCVSDLNGNGGHFVLVLLDSPDKNLNFLVYCAHDTLSEEVS